MVNSKNNRMAIVDLWKFIAAVMIMIHHLYYLSPAFEGKDYPGYFAWIYVEFFFILTGYFTYRHFAGRDRQENLVRSSLSYTYRKFKPFLPYTTIAITLQYLLSAPVWLKTPSMTILIPFEDASLTSSSKALFPPSIGSTLR